MANDLGAYLKRAARVIGIGGGLASGALEPAVLGNIPEIKSPHGIEARLQEAPKPPNEIRYKGGVVYAQEPNGGSALPTDRYNRVNMDGLKLYVKKDYDGAIKKFQEAITLDPNISAAYINMANALQDSGKIDEAIPLYLIGIQKSPEHSIIARVGLATAYKAKGMRKEALEQIEIYESMAMQEGGMTAKERAFVNNLKAELSKLN